ncbi:DUF2252 domain-containing protein [Bordetella hinzii]|uniref:DUF2252 domain-containing protein n=1 Tax=Bordetella hinzii TaxID=103855 RepID=UPI0013EFDAC9|nr:DUF2252 domain-containing protein [Bordetella hinzii]QII86435.1 DUF2252 domain-containing protein [Bordetella hinzii]
MSTSSRQEQGKALRAKVGRADHAMVGKLDRDPVALLKLSSEGRVPRLVPLRFGRMLASPLAFFRGSAIIQAHDLAHTPHSGLTMQICGDAHLSNFGGFASPERTLLFDLNDFDETAIGPWEWDLKRLCVSLVVAARNLNYKRPAAEAVLRQAVLGYSAHMKRYAEMGTLEIWYDRISFEGLMAEAVDDEVRRRLQRAMDKAAGRTGDALLPRLSMDVNGQRILRDEPPALFHVTGKNTLFTAQDDWLQFKDQAAALGQYFKDYLQSLATDRRELLSHFSHHDVAFKVVGVGSVGTRCLVHLMMDPMGKPMFLQSKEAGRSVVSRYFKAARMRHEGQRVVHGQRLMQAASDPFLGWAKGPNGRHFYVRQLRDMKWSAQVELMPEDILQAYGGLCGRVLAHGHAKAGGQAPELAGYLGSGERMADALTRYSLAYADQVERDYEVFAKACRKGALVARTDADMEADFRI